MSVSSVSRHRTTPKTGAELPNKENDTRRRRVKIAWDSTGLFKRPLHPTQDDNRRVLKRPTLLKRAVLTTLERKKGVLTTSDRHATCQRIKKDLLGDLEPVTETTIHKVSKIDQKLLRPVVQFPPGTLPEGMTKIVACKKHSVDPQKENYAIDLLRGSGAYKLVWECCDLDNPDKAVCLVQPFYGKCGPLQTPGENERLLKEFRLLKATRTPGELIELVIYDNKHGSERMFYLQTAYDGTLSDCDLKKLSYQERINFLKQLTQQCLLLEKWRTVHFDLKASNILYNKEEKRLRIADFGLAQHIGEEFNSTKCGTYLCMPPEIARSQLASIQLGEKFLEKIDVWSLGLLFYVILDENATKVDGVDNNPVVQAMREAKVSLGSTHRDKVNQLAFIGGLGLSSDEKSPYKEWLPVRENPSELDLLVREMLHADPEKRLTFSQVAERLSQIVL